MNSTTQLTQQSLGGSARQLPAEESHAPELASGTGAKADLEDPGGEEDNIVKRTIEAAHCTVTIDSEVSPFTAMGYITWRCKECEIWRVPGAPFSLVGDARVFNATCTFGDTGLLCCNCERMKELLLWKGKTVQLHRRGQSALSPPVLVVDKASHHVIWNRDEHGMQPFIEMMQDAKPLDSSTSRSAWYSEMACNHCRARVGLKTHEEVARQVQLDAQARAQEAAENKKKKGKKGGLGKKAGKAKK